MSEKVARALGAAADTEPIKVNGKPCEVRPVTVKYLTEIQRECLRQFRRSYLENYKENLDLMGKTLADMPVVVDQVGRWDVHDLPVKTAYAASSLEITPEVKAWLRENILDEDVTDEGRLRAIAASALDNGMFKEADYIARAGGRPPRKGALNYVGWWVTATLEGMVEMAYASFRDQGVTKEDIHTELGNNFAALAELSRKIESVTTPQIEGTAAEDVEGGPEGNAKAGA